MSQEFPTISFSTACFCNVRKLKPWQVPLSTACYDPKWFHDFHGPSYKFLDSNNVINGLRAEFLHPGKCCEGLCHGKPCLKSPDTCDFLKAYHKQIFSLNKGKVIARLQSLAKKLGVGTYVELVLLVHEAQSNPCSERKVLQDFFQCKETDFSLHSPPI